MTGCIEIIIHVQKIYFIHRQLSSVNIREKRKETKYAHH